MNPYVFYDPRCPHPIYQPRLQAELVDMFLEEGRRQLELARRELAAMPKQPPKPVKKSCDKLLVTEIVFADRCSLKKTCFDVPDSATQVTPTFKVGDYVQVLDSNAAHHKLRGKVTSSALADGRILVYFDGMQGYGSYKTAQLAHEGETAVEDLTVGDVVRVVNRHSVHSGKVGRVTCVREVDRHAYFHVYFPSSAVKHGTFCKTHVVKVDPSELPSKTGLRIGDLVRVDDHRKALYLGEVANVVDIDVLGDNICITFLDPRLPTKLPIYGRNVTKLG